MFASLMFICLFNVLTKYDIFVPVWLYVIVCGKFLYELGWFLFEIESEVKGHD